MDHSFLSTFKVKCHLTFYKILFALVKVKQSVQVVVCVLSKGCLAPTFVRAKQVKYVVIRTQTQMSRNKSIDDDDVDLLQLDVQE